jgi:hypothetical protein
VVWYRARFTRPSAEPLTLAIAVDDYAEVVVDGAVVGHISGYNGVVYAPLGAGPVGAGVTVLVLGINAPLGAPPDFPWWFVLRNEVFLRTPVRLLRGDPDPRPSPTTPSTTPSTSTVLQPTRRCRVVVQDRVLSPQVQDRATCEAPDEAGPRWLRFDVDVGRDGWLHVVGDGCAEVWIDGALAAEVGAGAMSPPAGGQRVHVDAGRPCGRRARVAGADRPIRRHGLPRPRRHARRRPLTRRRRGRRSDSVSSSSHPCG